jgi:hypothetical protein
LDDLASRLRDLPALRGDSLWPGHEYVKGWACSGYRSTSGRSGIVRLSRERLLAVRNAWHRDPEPHRSIYVDGPRLATAADVLC